ncbi:hypothetical protein [uncultured Clostridium sp.]|mgnify:FL=1|uniref:hypothetical protein n=1 Tax=uncultured Clostridium sp. TaxID=59620 RepID=UPI0026DBED20|nr:hypothetical protein [uncultured Clostridium sp.]
MKWLEKIRESENINLLPSYGELSKIAENEGVDLYEEWSNGIDIVITDGTNIRLEVGHRCFNSKDEWYFYVVEDIYICAECGLMQSSYDEIKEEVGYIDDIFIKLLPLNWDINAVRSYLKKGIKKQKELERNREYYSKLRNNTFDFLQGCSTCTHMRHDECVFGNYDCDGNCEDYEER